MATEKECAALSVLACDPRCGREAGFRGFAPPAGWSPLEDLTPSLVLQGFNVCAFDSDHGETVLAMAGPDFISDALAVSQDAEEFVINLALDMGLASYTEMLHKAAHAYALLRQRALRDGRDPNRIHLAGHGVGGGVASVMATWFDQPCTVFAHAPLRAVALKPGDFCCALQTMESVLGSDDGAVKALQGFIRFPREVLAQREQLRVAHWHVRGEVYALLRSSATAIQGTEHAVDIGIQPLTVETALTLHDMKLHAALLFDPRLSLLCQASPDLLSLLIDREEGCDLIDTLLGDQHRAGLEAESALQRFVSGLEWRSNVPVAGVLSNAEAG